MNWRWTSLAIQPGDEAHLDVLHDGQTKDVTVKVGTAAERADRQRSTTMAARRTTPDRLGPGAAVAGHARAA